MKNQIMIIARIHSFFLKTKEVAFLILISATFCILQDVAKTNEILQGKNDEGYVASYFIYDNLGIGKLWRSSVDATRSKDIAQPGYYYRKPLGQSIDVDSLDIKFINSLIKPYLSSYYYDDSIFDFTENYYLPMYDRKEFFFNVISNDTLFKFSGWYGKFAHIIVTTEFDSQDGFIKKAQHFFNLPTLDTNKVLYNYDEEILSDERHEFFYSYNDDNADFKLVGYTVIKPGSTSIGCQIEKVVLDLTIYAKGDEEK